MDSTDLLQQIEEDININPFTIRIAKMCILKSIENKDEISFYIFKNIFNPENLKNFSRLELMEQVQSVLISTAQNKVFHLNMEDEEDVNLIKEEIKYLEEYLAILKPLWKDAIFLWDGEEINYTETRWNSVIRQIHEKIGKNKE
jgi:nitrogen regulatory protein PII-like uncharacterized protein